MRHIWRKGRVLVRVTHQLLEKDRLNGRTAANWEDAKYRVFKSYREWIRAVCISKLEFQKQNMARGVVVVSKFKRNKTILG